FEEYAGISSHVPRLRGVIVNEDPKENKFFADLRRQIKEYNFVSDIRNADIALPGGVSVTWGLGMGCPFGGWGLQIHDLAGEYRLCNIYDAVENALLTDEDGILSKGLKGAFGRDVPVSAVTGIEIYHYQEGEYAGMIGVDAVVDFPGLERTQGVFMIYAARSAGDNGKAKSEAEELMRRCAVSAEYTPEIYGDCTGTAREVDKSYMIEMFAEEMLADYWEVNVCSREHFGDKAPNKHKRGLGLVVNKGGRNRGEGGFIEDPGIESAMKEESVRAAVFCTDLNTWRFSRYSFNRGDFIFRFIEGERPKVKVISSGNLTAGFDGRPTPEQNVVMGSLLPAWFLYAQERDTVTLMQNIESTGTVANEPLDYVYEPREVFQGMTLGLMDRFGNFGISMAEVWLKEYITRSRTGEILNTLNLKYVSPEYNDFCIAEAHRYLRMLESPAAAQLDTALDLMAFRETWDGI
ncbi:MAG: hypothetical protein ABH825_00735, partial [Candidatus Omnitrophota bacterium]